MAGQSASFDDQDEHGGKILFKDLLVEALLARIFKFKDRKSRCIYKVSDHIRKPYESEPYTPQVISIGPFHHKKNPKLQKMEDFKLRCLESFTGRAETKREDIVRAIKDAEKSVRKCYSEKITLHHDDFVKMILRDASFIIEYFSKSKTNIWTENDWEISNPWWCKRVQMDLILLENQLPFFIIEKIYDTAFPSQRAENPFIELSFSQFECYNVQKFHHSESEEILHFTDLVRNFFLPPRGRRPERKSEIIKEMHSATQLDSVGLKFKMSSSSNIRSPLELKYHADGVLEIPQFQLDKKTQIHARNLIAFEQCHFPHIAYITDYYFLLRLLIRSQRDADLFVQKKIMTIDCVDHYMDAIFVLNNILENIDRAGMNNDYSQLAEESNKFYKGRVTYLQKMMANLKRDYFSTPWRGAATIGGILLLLLTVIQTVCALTSVKNWK